MFTLSVHSAESMHMHILTNIHSFTYRFVISILLILLSCRSPDRISINLDQTQGLMRPELCWNQARGRLFYYLPGWMSNTDHYIAGGMQSTEQMVALIRNRS